MPESQNQPSENVTAASTAKVATVSQTARLTESMPKATPAENKVYSPETDNQFSAAEMEALINRAKEPKVETPKVETPVPPVSDNTPKGLPAETAKAPEIPKSEVGIEEKIAKIVEEKLGKAQTPQQSKPEDKFFGFGSQEALDAAYVADPTGTTRKLLEAQFSEMIQKSIDEKIKPFTEKLAPITERIESERVTHNMSKAIEFAPELKDPNSPMAKEFTKFISDTANHDEINLWAKQGKTPEVEIVKRLRAENISAYIASAKEQGIKEGEERAIKAGRATVEGGGKAAFEENMSVEKFDKMSSAEQEKYLISKGAYRR